MKKTISIFLILVTTLSCTACNPQKIISKFINKDEENTTKIIETNAFDTNEVKATKTVKNFMNSVCDLNIKSASKFADNTQYIPASIRAISSPEDYKNQMLKFLPPPLSEYKDDLSDTYDIVFDAIQKSFTYEVIDAEEMDSETVVVTVDIQVPSADTMDNFSNEVTNELTELASATLDKALNSSSIEESISTVVPNMLELLNKTAKEYSRSIETQSLTVNFVVYEDNDEWIINTKESFM